MHRREGLKISAFGAAALALTQSAISLDYSIPILDAHIHLFDPTRAGGVPWPEKDDKILYKPALPDRYEALTKPFGVVGAIAIEASPLASDNHWLLEIARRYPVIVGVVGDLVPSSPDFMKQLDALHRNALFLGIRYGNLWNRDLRVDLEESGFLNGLKALAQTGLVLESANPDPRLIRAIVNVTERVPDLRIVIDHLPHAPIPTDKTARAEYWSDLRRLAESPHVFVKLSEIPVLADGNLVTDANFYQARLDALWNTFGENRVIFGSDWPNSDHVASYAKTFAIVHEYVEQKSPQMREKYYWRNSINAYRWHRRRSDQPSI
jgi:L-fuconolactonase